MTGEAARGGHARPVSRGGVEACCQGLVGGVLALSARGGWIHASPIIQGCVEACCQGWGVGVEAC